MTVTEGRKLLLGAILLRPGVVLLCHDLLITIPSCLSCSLAFEQVTGGTAEPFDLCLAASVPWVFL